MIIKNEDFAINIITGPSPNCSDLASEEAKFIKVTITAKTKRGRKKLANFKFNSNEYKWIDKSKTTLSIKCYGDFL